MSWRVDADLNPGDGSSFSAARKSEALSSSDLRAFAVQPLRDGRSSDSRRFGEYGGFGGSIRCDES